MELGIGNMQVRKNERVPQKKWNGRAAKIFTVEKNPEK